MIADTPDSRLRTADQHVIEQMPWGRLEWFVSARIGNSETMTVGVCVLEPGAQNSRHFHPNCDEVLRVLKGRIVQTWDDQEHEMGVGDVISIPSGVTHNARNIGRETAELAICFSSAYRETVDVDVDVAY
jgi:quercetin dioxygenase-like cupin family protein